MSLHNRIPVSQSTIDETNKLVDYMLNHRINKKGDLSFTSRHEALGVITEEYFELIEAIKDDTNQDRFLEEMVDVAVACLFGIASILEENKYKHDNLQ